MLIHFFFFFFVKIPYQNTHTHRKSNRMIRIDSMSLRITKKKKIIIINFESVSVVRREKKKSILCKFSFLSLDFLIVWNRLPKKKEKKFVKTWYIHSNHNDDDDDQYYIIHLFTKIISFHSFIFVRKCICVCFSCCCRVCIVAWDAVIAIVC